MRITLWIVLVSSCGRSKLVFTQDVVRRRRVAKGKRLDEEGQVDFNVYTKEEEIVGLRVGVKDIGLSGWVLVASGFPNKKFGFPFRSSLKAKKTTSISLWRS